MISICEHIIRIVNSNVKAALCTIISTKGSTPLKTGAKMIVCENGRIFGTVGGGSLEKKVTEDAMEWISLSKSGTVKYELLKELEMCCGGIVEVFIEPLVNRKNLLIFGAGHVGKALAHYSRDFNFNISLIDERNEMFEGVDQERIKHYNITHREFLNSFTMDENTLVVICTHSHSYDREILSQCINQPLAYLGMIGSMRKVKVTRKIFLEQKITDEKTLNNVDMPMGFDIGAKSPEEIAISILAKLIQVMNAGHKSKNAEKKFFETDELCNHLVSGIINEQKSI